MQMIKKSVNTYLVSEDFNWREMFYKKTESFFIYCDLKERTPVFVWLYRNLSSIGFPGGRGEKGGGNKINPMNQTLNFVHYTCSLCEYAPWESRRQPFAFAMMKNSMARVIASLTLLLVKLHV